MGTEIKMNTQREQVAEQNVTSGRFKRRTQEVAASVVGFALIVLILWLAFKILRWLVMFLWAL